jgi:hypothetical protein
MPKRASASGKLVCLIYDDALRTVFEWAAKEFAGVAGGLAIDVRTVPLSGLDDGRQAKADVVLLPSWAVSRAARRGTIIPAEDAMPGGAANAARVLPGILQLTQSGGKLWGFPLLVGGHFIAAEKALLAQYGVAADSLTRVEDILDVVERASAARAWQPGKALFNIAVPVNLMIATALSYPGAKHIPMCLAHADRQSIFERIKELTMAEGVEYKRFDEEDTFQPDRYRVLHALSGTLCRTVLRDPAWQLLPVPTTGDGTVPLATYSLCVSTRSARPSQSWEWINAMGSVLAATRLAALGYDLPVSTDPEPWKAFGGIVGTGNADLFRRLLDRPNPMYGMWQEDVPAFLSKVLYAEIHRFMVGQQSYEEMLHLVRQKTELFLKADAPA